MVRVVRKDSRNLLASAAAVAAEAQALHILQAPRNLRALRLGVRRLQLAWMPTVGVSIQLTYAQRWGRGRDSSDVHP